MNGLHLFIDNSNLFIGARGTARYKFQYDDDFILRLRVNYGALLEQIKENRKLMETVLVGSRPPQNDSLWNKLKSLNIEPRIFDRSFYSGKEKRVDAELTNTIRDTLEDNSIAGTIALVAGDQDYMPTLERCTKKNWKVELYFWEHAVSNSLKTLSKITFYNLDDWFNKITYIEKIRE